MRKFHLLYLLILGAILISSCSHNKEIFEFQELINKQKDKIDSIEKFILKKDKQIVLLQNQSISQEQRINSLANDINNKNLELSDLQEIIRKYKEFGLVKIDRLECDEISEELKLDLSHRPWFLNAKPCVMCLACGICSCTQEDYLISGNYSIARTNISCLGDRYKLKISNIAFKCDSIEFQEASTKAFR